MMGRDSWMSRGAPLSDPRWAPSSDPRWGASTAPCRFAVEPAAHTPHERTHARAAVVPSDVAMEVAPEPLDAVVLGTVGRQEVQDEHADPLEIALGLLALVNHVVVEDQVDPACLRVGRPQLFEERDEPVRVLVIRGRVDKVVL